MSEEHVNESENPLGDGNPTVDSAADGEYKQTAKISPAGESLADKSPEVDTMQGQVKRRGRPPGPAKPASEGGQKPQDSKIVKLLEKNPLGMTLPEMAGGTRQIKRIKTLRPLLAEAIHAGLVMPVSQRAGHTVYKLVKNMGPR